jgi:hypothetical protein
MQAEPMDITMTVINALKDLGVRYVIESWLASAVHNVVRATMDADPVPIWAWETLYPSPRG